MLLKKGSILLLGILVFLSACSSSTAPGRPSAGKEQASSPAAVSSAAAPSDDGKQGVKIGLVYPLSGPFASNGINIQRGALLAIEDYNKNGGIKSMGGAKVVPVSADSSGDPSTAASTARKLITQDKVSILIGSYISSLTLTVATEAERAKVPLVTQSYAKELVDNGNKFTFKITPFAGDIGSATLTYVNEMIKDNNANIKKVAIVSSNDSTGVQQLNGAADQAKKLGFEVNTIQYPVGLTDASSIIGKVKTSGAEMMFIYGPTEDITLILQGLNAIGSKIPVVGMGGAGIVSTDFIKTVGKISDGIMSSVTWNWDITDKAKEVSTRYKEKYNVPFVPPEVGLGYLEGAVALLGIEQAGSGDPEKIRNALSKMKLTDFPANMFTGKTIEFKENGHNPNSFPLMVQFKDGVPNTVWPKEYQKVQPVLK